MGGPIGFSMFKWKKHPGERQLFERMGLALFHPSPCVQTEHIMAFCMDEHPQEKVTLDMSPLPLPRILSVFKLAISLKNHIVLFQITTKK